MMLLSINYAVVAISVPFYSQNTDLHLYFCRSQNCFAKYNRKLYNDEGACVFIVPVVLVSSGGPLSECLSQSEWYHHS